MVTKSCRGTFPVARRQQRCDGLAACALAGKRLSALSIEAFGRYRLSRLHHKHDLPGELEIPMESFARAVEIVLKDSELRDAPGYRPDAALWTVAIRSCGYIQSRQAVSEELAGMAG